MVKATKKGYLVTWTGYSDYYRAMVQGAVRGRKVLVNYSETFPRGLNLNEAINKSNTTNAEWIEHEAEHLYQTYLQDGHVRGARILARGEMVQ